ncbi:hypothetical protein [Flavobacterium laiguense]|uniref:Uncharacterized protein n=1 Tax=Flavobacterium laiguense TaxID=2169409 RepID=A0A2U1K3A1_9FLAO|nr:hypothetical protein [Flavobacterium laiguense]PWA11654.1 hypothetical protein DB891_02285 [Flavobacterium laiguense]
MNKKYYTLILNDSQHIKQTASIEKIDLKKIIYVIESNWKFDSASKNNNFYKHIIKNNSIQDIIGNFMVLDDIKCSFEGDETWSVVIKPNHYAVCQKVKITDKLDFEKVIPFDNSEHSEVFFKELLSYVEKLNKYGTHIAIEDINYRDKTITRLESKILDLQKQLKFNHK